MNVRLKCIGAPCRKSFFTS